MIINSFLYNFTLFDTWKINSGRIFETYIKKHLIGWSKAGRDRKC